MGSISLLSFFFLGFINLWSVDCNSSAQCGSNFSGNHFLKRAPCGFKPNISYGVPEEEKLLQKINLPRWLKAEKAQCPQGVGEEGVHTCPPATATNKPSKTLLRKRTEEDPTTSGDLPTGSQSNRTSMVVPDTVLAYLQSRWLTRFVPSVYTVVFCLSLPLNVMAIVIFVFKSQINMPSVVFMLNLAVADILLASMLPFDIIYRFSGNNWFIGEGMCRFVIASLYCNHYCSVLLTASISVDRFLAVVYPMQSLSWRTVSRAWLICFFIWMVSISASLPLLMSNLTLYIEQLNVTTCGDVLAPEDVQSFYFPYFITYIVVFFFLPFIILTFCYAATIRTLRLSIVNRRINKSRSILLCLTVLCEFTFCFGPANIIFLAYYLNMPDPICDYLFFVYILAVCVSITSCCLDPIIYYYGSSKYKKHLYNFICCGNWSKFENRRSSRITGGESSGQAMDGQSRDWSTHAGQIPMK